VSEVIVDAGPLVALLIETDDHHRWVVERLRELPPPFLTCEPVLGEVARSGGYVVRSSASSIS